MELAKLLVAELRRVAVRDRRAASGRRPAAGCRRRAGAEAVRILEGLLQSAEHKARVVDILRPIYERADDWRHLIAVNDERLALASDDGERVAVLRESAKLWEERGGNQGKAFEAVREAWTLDPEDGDAREQLDRLAAATARWDDLASAYETAIAKTDGFAKRELLAALAQLHDKKRDDPRRALEAWERLFSLDETELEPPRGDGRTRDAAHTLVASFPRTVFSTAKQNGGLVYMIRETGKTGGDFLFVSDFDQTLSFNDSGISAERDARHPGISGKDRGLSRIHMVQQGGELAYLLLHDPEFRRVRREHLVEAGKRMRLKKNIRHPLAHC